MARIWEKFKDVSSISVADITASGISAAFWFYVASMLGPETYGHITYALSIAGLASTISILGASNTLTIYTAKKIPIQPALYIITLSAGVISSIVVFLIFFDLGISLLILGYIIFGLIIAEILGRKLYKEYAKYVLTQRILMVILGIGLYYIIGESGIIIGISISFMPYIYGIMKGFRKNKVDFVLVKERMGFITNSYLQTLSGVLSGSLDKLIIGPLFGFALLGNYSLGLQFLSLLNLIPIAVAKYLMPNDATGNENIKLKKILVLFATGVAVLGFTIGPYVITSIFPKFVEAEEILQIVSISVIPSTIAMVYQTKFLGREKSRLVLISSVLWTGVQIVGIVVLGNIYGVNGIALSLLLAATASAIYCIFADKLLLERNI
jgi:O-antigen/teichoic acid export membrane protein